MKPAPLPQHESARLRLLWDLGILDTAEEAAFDDLARLAAQVCNTPIALISLIDRERQWFKSRYGFALRETPREQAVCAYTILGDDLLVVEDTAADERFRHLPLVTGTPAVRFYAGAPLPVNDLPLGTLCVAGPEPRRLSPVQADALRTLARQVAGQLARRLEHTQLDRAKDAFIAMVSHELHTPLTSICGSLSLLKHHKVGPLDPEPLRLVELAHRNADRLQELVTGILDVTRLEAGLLRIAPQRLELSQLVRAAVAGSADALERGGCEVRLDGVERKVWVHGDGQRLLQALSSLVSNAAKFSDRGGRIEVRLRAECGKARVEVTDHGPGIPLHQQPLLFKKLQQLGSFQHQKLPGTGLGLHVCQRIVELHRGELGFESRPFDCTTFHISLPQAPGDPLD